LRFFGRNFYAGAQKASAPSEGHAPQAERHASEQRHADSTFRTAERLKHRMAMQRILIAEDDAKTASLLRLYLEHAGYAVHTAPNGRAALAAVENQKPSLLLLDLMLPEINGLDVCRTLRARGDLPIIMLTARTTEEDKLRGLHLGADDYVCKPFSPREVVARVRTVLRRASAKDAGGPPVLHLGGVEVNRVRHEAKRDGRTLPLTRTEFCLLEALAAAPGRAFTRRQLLERSLGEESDALERTVDAHIKNLRKKLGAAGEQIVTVHGVGYKATEAGDAA